ncbi:MAG: FAD-dependent oxidoreductase [Chloroflexi bacterium]|nr:FAD-dependent oxidoreductase [Chloroflexota bacterium]
MPHYRYLIIGGGMAADAAVHGIRGVDPDGSIGLIGEEIDPPYRRPPLSKGLWTGESVDSIWSGTESLGVELQLGCSAKTLDARNKRVVDDQGTSYTFDRLLLATGGRPRRLPFGDDHVVYFRDLADYRRLRALAERGRRFGVIGGGFIGWEIAAALALLGKEVVLIFPGGGIGSRLFPPELSGFLNDFYREKGVDVVPHSTVTGAASQGDQVTLTISDGREMTVDGVVAGLGIELNVELAQGAGLVVDNGIVVDEFLRTSHPDIYAAGDVAACYSPALGKRRRVEHEDNATTMGRLAGRAMAGAPEVYHHLPSFYSDLFDLGFEGVGEVDARLEVVSDWKEPCREGVLYYLQGDRVRGVLLWNVWEQVEAARQLVAESGPVRPADLKGRIPAGA